MLKPVSERYVTYLEEKASLETFFSAIDHDASGAIEQEEVQRLLRELGAAMAPAYEPVEADVHFVYDACKAERGAPLPPGPQMLLLRPALAEWKRMVEMRRYQARVAAYQAKKARSSACVLM